MKRLWTLLSIVALLVVGRQAQAQSPGDVGSPQCGAAQSSAQTAVSGGGPYKNHGQQVKTAAHVVSPLEAAGTITAECSSCIMNQFARSVPIAQQTSCGVPPRLVSCVPSGSLSALIQGTNVTSYVAKAAWSTFTSATGVARVQVEGSGIPSAVISTPSFVNSCASNSVTGQTVCAANNTDVYVISGSSLSSTLTSGGSSNASFSGGSCTNCGVAINAVTNQALITLSTGSGPGFQFLDLSTSTFGATFASPSGNVSEDIQIDPVRNLALSPTESSNYELVDISSPSTPTFFENPFTPFADFDSAAEDCTTGIALASDEFTGNIFIADLTQATFTPGSPSGTWSAPSQLQNLQDFNFPSAGTSGIAVAPGSHVGVVTDEFGGSAFGAIQLPSTSGSGTPAILDWVKCDMPDDPTATPWSMGLDPHPVTAYTSPNSGDAMALIANAPSPPFGGPPPTFVAVVDLTKLLNTAVVPRLAGTHTCDPITNLATAGVVSFVPVP